MSEVPLYCTLLNWGMHGVHVGVNQGLFFTELHTSNIQDAAHVPPPLTLLPDTPTFPHTPYTGPPYNLMVKPYWIPPPRH